MGNTWIYVGLLILIIIIICYHNTGKWDCGLFGNIMGTEGMNEQPIREPRRIDYNIDKAVSQTFGVPMPN